MSTDLKRKPQTQPATRISLTVLGVLIIMLVVGCRASQNQEAALPPGTYRLVLTADQSPGILSVYWSYR